MTKKAIPPKLYKYCTFNSNSLRLLCRDEIYFANPDSFNDPLDCKPIIKIDTDEVSKLEMLYYRMQISAIKKAHPAYQILKTKYRNEPGLTDLKERILNEIKEKVKDKIQDDRYASSEFGDYKTNLDASAYYKNRLSHGVKLLLQQEMASRGVLSMAERWDRPLMWSHYADNHRGICIEYDMSEHNCDLIKPIDYERSRNINITDLFQWKLHKSSEAERKILDIYFFTKAGDWEYEQEWRIIHQSNGSHPAPFRISGVYFGLRCDISVIASVVKLLSGSIDRISFYELNTVESGFSLDRQMIDLDEINHCGIETAGGLLDLPNLSA